MNRRGALQFLQSALVVSSATWVASPVFAAKKVDKRPLALLVPMTGEHAELGLSMRNAAMLAQNDPSRLLVFDTAGTPAGATAAAQAAQKKKAAMILGPLTQAEARAVAGTVPSDLPVIAFTNDPAIRSTGAFVFGITAASVTGAVLRYARSRGVRKIAVISDGTPWSILSASTARNMQGSIGMDVRTIEVVSGQPAPAAGDAPDAILVPGGGDALLAAARNLQTTGIQLLATVQGLDHRPASLEALDGAWIAAPDPDSFGDFASAFTSRNGGSPGAIAALAHDATFVAEQLRAKDMLSRGGLLAETSFDCVTGPLRFRTDGSVARDMAILVAGPAGYEKVAVSQGA
ncbi:ABC transporter substrate-binding protein [Sphingomonas japonica]|uniref:ABC transporter substrate-binding protein n=1 Tax=Sphingomonas japonica TaxID=511662 RepID=UPI0011212801